MISCFGCVSTSYSCVECGLVGVGFVLNEDLMGD